ncbi:MAG: hypothetical protein AB7V08_13730 [Elusimicrobiales bacterium]
MTETANPTEPKQELIPANAKPRDLALAGDGRGSAFLDLRNFEVAQRMAVALSRSTMVPDAYSMHKTDPQTAAGNCVIALDLAFRLDVSPLIIMQQVDVVKGRPGLRGAFCASLINTRGGFDGPLEYEWKGAKGTPEWGCRAVASRKGRPVNGAWIDMQMVVSEGWINNAKWKNMPEQMFPYRAAAFFGRQHCPEVLMGAGAMNTTDELEDLGDAPREVKAHAPVGTLLDKLDAADAAEGKQEGDAPPAGDSGQNPPARRARRQRHGAAAPGANENPAAEGDAPAAAPAAAESPQQAGDDDAGFNVE